ncbi:Polyphosphate kinase [Sodalis praecaptivus]
MHSERYVDKELSWLVFNERVLQEAEDVTNPLVERICFLGIYSSNRDEFYKIRFADLRRNLLISAAQGKDEGYRRLLAEVKHKIAKNSIVFTMICCGNWLETRFFA